MKLLNREPTEEMVKAGSYVLRNVSTSLTEVYQAMHDAAPAIKVDMGPVATVDESDEGLFIEICYDEYGSNLKFGDKLYSAEQVATIRGEGEVLQAENERLKKSCEYNFALYQDMGVKVHELAAERDELLDFIKYAEVDSGVCCCGDSMENHPSGMNCGHSPVDMWDNAVVGLIAKYEGEKQ